MRQGFSVLDVENGTRRSWMNRAAAASSTWKIARCVASRMYCESGGIARQKNLSLKPSWKASWSEDVFCSPERSLIAFHNEK